MVGNAVETFRSKKPGAYQIFVQKSDKFLPSVIVCSIDGYVNRVLFKPNFVIFHPIFNI